MSKKATKLAALALFCVFTSASLLTGCGGAADTTTTAATTKAADTTAAATAADTTAADTTAAAKDLPVVGISTGSSGTSWRTIMIDALDQVGKEYKDAGIIADYEIVNNVTNGDATEQANILRDFISAGVDIIMVNPNSSDALNGVIAEAQEAGILVVSFDATVTAPDVLNVTLDHYAWAEKIATWIADQLGGEGNVVEISGLDGHPANNLRVQATADVFAKYPDLNFISSTPGGWDQTIAKEVMTQILASGQQIDGIVTQDGEAYGVLSACIDADKLPKVMFADPGTAFFKAWKDLRDEGVDFNACAQPNPPGIGGTAFRMAVNLYNGKEFKDGILDGEIYYYVVSSFYTNDNFDEAWEMLKDKPDDYLLSEIMTQEDCDALFQ